MNARVSVPLGILAIVAAAAAAADDAPPPMGVWTGKGQLGFLSSNGNTDAESLNAALDMTRLDGAWKHALDMSGLYGRSADVVSAERWETRWQTNYDLTPRLFTFGALHYEHDLFSGFQYQTDASLGLGYKIVNTDATKLSVQLGAGFQQLRPEELDKNAVGEVTARVLLRTQKDVIETAGLDFSQTITQTTTLTNKFLMESGPADTVLHNTLGLAVKISTKLALSLGYGLQDNTKPPPGVKKLDTVVTANLVYSF